MARRAPLGLWLRQCGCCSEQENTANPRNMSLQCLEIILASASSLLHSAHTYVNWTFPPSGLCAIPNHSLYYAGQWISVIQVMLALANWQEESPTTATPLQKRTPKGRSQSAANPASCVLFYLRGFDLTPSASITLKTFMYHISRGKRRRREKAILAYSKRHTRGLCLSTSEYLSQAGGESKPLCAFTTKNVALFKMETSKKKNSVRGRRKRSWHSWSFDMYLSEVR